MPYICTPNRLMAMSSGPSSTSSGFICYQVTLKLNPYTLPGWGAAGSVRLPEPSVTRGVPLTSFFNMVVAGGNFDQVMYSARSGSVRLWKQISSQLRLDHTVVSEPLGVLRGCRCVVEAIDAWASSIAHNVHSRLTANIITTYFLDDEVNLNSDPPLPVSSTPHGTQAQQRVKLNRIGVSAPSGRFHRAEKASAIRTKWLFETGQVEKARARMRDQGTTSRSSSSNA